jgi:hypothetical protein
MDLAYSMKGQKRNLYRLLLGNPERKKLGRTRLRWVEVKMHFGEMGWGGMDCIGMAQDRDQWRAHVNAVINLRIPLNARRRSWVQAQAVACRVLLSSIKSVQQFIRSINDLLISYFL